MFRGEGDRSTEQLAVRNELERQADIYRGLGVSKDAIMQLVAPRPDRLPRELKIPIVTLGTSVDLNRQADFAGIKTYYDLSCGHDIAGGITYDEPHLIWVQDGSKYRGKSVERVRRILKRNERPATQSDGIAIAIVNLGVHGFRDDHFIDLPGTAVEPNFAPALEQFGGELKLLRSWAGDAHPHWGSASCWG